MFPSRAGSGARRDPGSVLVLTLVVSLTIGLLLAGAIFTTVTMARSSQFVVNHAAAVALSEAAAEMVQKNMLTSAANFQPFPLTGTVSVDSNNYPYTVTVLGSQVTRVDSDGFNDICQAYRISTTASVANATSNIARIVEISNSPLFQYMIFYNGDLELLPGQNMTLGGRVHTNGSIYIGAGSTGTLTVDTDYLRSTRDILRKRKDDGSPTGGTVSIKVLGTSTYANMTVGNDSSNPNWLNVSNNTWKGTVESQAHGVKEVSSPKIGSVKAIDPSTGQKGFYHAGAGMVIKNTQAYDQSGAVIPLPAGTITEKTMYDGREGKVVKVTDVDVGLLNSSGRYPANGLLYAYRTDASPSQPNGVRLSNGATLLAPLTVVSEDPVYIKGDFNTVAKKGVAVVSDAVNLLSKAWNDTKTAGTLPVAQATQYNVAIFTGNVPTPSSGGNYSGGFENLPRLHENWAGKTLTIRGAFINIFQSEIAKGLWKLGGDVYSAPLRDWQYDPQDMSNPPPFTPSAVQLRRLLWDDGIPLPFSGK